MSPSHSRLSPPALSDDDIVAIFLRIPPDDPARLVRASLVCKAWRRVLTDPQFCRLYREFHGTPPMLGFAVSSWIEDMDYVSRFIPTFRLSAGIDSYPSNWRFVDSRHGRILVGLVDDDVGFFLTGGYIVWDPITNGRLGVPSPGPHHRIFSWTAAVLCAKEHCDHLGCHEPPFLVAMVSSKHGTTSACVYSSESGVWSDTITLDYWDQLDIAGHSVLMRNTLHFTLFQSGNVLQYNLGEQTLSVIELPYKNRDEDGVPSVLISAEDDVLVFAGSDLGGTRLSLWSTKAGALGWVKRKVIDLEKLLPPRAFEPKPDAGEYEYMNAPCMCGFAEGIVFLTTLAGLFTVELSSGRTKKVAEVERAYNVIPWISFYTPDRARRMMPQAHSHDMGHPSMSMNLIPVSMKNSGPA